MASDEDIVIITDLKKSYKLQDGREIPVLRNISLNSDSAACKYAFNIMAFPTTILVDRNGNIVGDPMLGGIDNKDNYDTLMKQIQSVIDADTDADSSNK